jgi:hypothetical protein
VRNREADPVAAEDLCKGLIVRGWETGGIAVQKGLRGGMKLGAWRLSATVKRTTSY